MAQNGRCTWKFNGEKSPYGGCLFSASLMAENVGAPVQFGGKLCTTVVENVLA